MNETNPTLKKAKKLLKRIAKKLGKKDARIVCQISTDNEHDDNYIVYAAMMSGLGDGVEPLTFAGFTKDEFIGNIKTFLEEKASPKELERVFYEGKINSAEATITWAKEQIEKLDAPDEVSEEDSEEKVSS